MVRYAEPVVCETWCVMLYQWSSIMESYAQPVVENHVLLCYGTEQHNMIHNTYLRITRHGSHLLAHHNTEWFTTTGSASHNEAHPLAQHSHRDSQPLVQHNTPWFSHTRLSITHNDSQPLAHHNSQWFTTTPVVMNQVVLCWASRWESRIERCAGGCELYCAMLSQSFWIAVCYA
jgi:hypothetical protein